jgi:hypothetical protein
MIFGVTGVTCLAMVPSALGVTGLLCYGVRRNMGVTWAFLGVTSANKKAPAMAGASN